MLLKVLLSILLIELLRISTSMDFDGHIPNPCFAVSWIDDRTIYQAGDRATIKIKVLNDSLNDGNLRASQMHFSVSVKGKKGNSSYISAVFSYFDGDPIFWNISFTPIQIGVFSVVIVEDFSGVADSSLHFSVNAGLVYPTACIPSWVDFINEFVAGTEACLVIHPKDAFGNNASLVGMPVISYFTMTSSYLNGSVAESLKFVSSDWNELGYVGIKFIPTIAGKLFLHVNGDNQALNGSPLPFTVKPGLLSVANSMAKWKYEINSLQIFSRLQLFIHQKDQFGNLVPGFYQFDAQVVQKSTGLSVPLADLLFQEVYYGIQLLSFVVLQAGHFVITIHNSNLNESISILPFTVFVGYCHGLKSFATGPGLVSSIAGRVSSFTVFLKDEDGNPSPLEAEHIFVEIYSKNDNFMIKPIIYPLSVFNETYHNKVARLNGLFMGSRTFIGNQTAPASEFKITYIPERSEGYEIRLFCGNIALNSAHYYFMKVMPGFVDRSKSKVVNLEFNVKRLENIDVFVELVDSYWNYVPLQEQKLSLQVHGFNTSKSLKIAFNQYKNGLYVGHFLPDTTGAHDICVSFEETILSPCPIKFYVNEEKYFPEANNDSVSVWEDESVVFDVMSNDYALDGLFRLIEFSKPFHGSLLQYGELFRYTPFKGYFGNDSFFYSINDSNNNIAKGTAYISVLCNPPQFISLPLQLDATEDLLCPQFGGFPGFEMMYSDKKDDISLTINAKFGSIFLSPSRFWFTEQDVYRISIQRGGVAEKGLILSGPIEAINSALQLLQYLSNENFYGEDDISFYAMNKNGVQDFHVPVIVKPVNDPPEIHVPEFIILGGNAVNSGSKIFDKQNDTFEFSITDSDIIHYTGNESNLMVMLSMEVNEGLLSTTLPSHLIKTAELKIKNSHQWQPLQTFVTIENHFIIKGKGIRFQGTIVECNNAMERLFFHGANLDALLTISVNDLGNYGCYNVDCTDMMSYPLSNETSVPLIRRRPLSPKGAILIGSALFFEILMLFLLGVLLLFFLCKCMLALYNTKCKPKEKLVHNIDEKIDAKPSHNILDFNGISTNGSLSRIHSNFRQRSCKNSFRTID